MDDYLARDGRLEMIMIEPVTLFLKSERKGLAGIKAAASVKDQSHLRGSAFSDAGAGIELVGRMDI